MVWTAVWYFVAQTEKKILPWVQVSPSSPPRLNEGQHSILTQHFVTGGSSLRPSHFFPPALFPSLFMCSANSSQDLLPSRPPRVMHLCVGAGGMQTGVAPECRG